MSSDVAEACRKYIIYSEKREYGPTTLTGGRDTNDSHQGQVLVTVVGDSQLITMMSFKARRQMPLLRGSDKGDGEVTGEDHGLVARQHKGSQISSRSPVMIIQVSSWVNR